MARHNLAHNSETDAIIYVDDSGNVVVDKGDDTPITIGVQTEVRYPVIRIGNAPTAPTVIEAAASHGWVFAVGDLCYIEFPLHPSIDRTKQILLGIGWAPVGTQAGKKVKWQADITSGYLGANLGLIDDTISTEVDNPATGGYYARTGLLIPIALFSNSDVDELHIRISRIASSADPTDNPALHHVVVIQYLK